MRANLMTFGSHASDCIDPLGSSVDLASAVGGAHNEEGGIGIVGFKQVKKVWCSVRRAVVESQGDSAGLRALVDRHTIWDVANKVACIS